jgi:hypothetical protein
MEMRRSVQSYISVGLYNILKREKKRLEQKEKRKRRGSRKKVITFYDASQSVVRKVTK